MTTKQDKPSRKFGLSETELNAKFQADTAAQPQPPQGETITRTYLSRGALFDKVRKLEQERDQLQTELGNTQFALEAMAEERDQARAQVELDRETGFGWIEKCDQARAQVAELLRACKQALAGSTLPDAANRAWRILDAAIAAAEKQQKQNKK